MLGWQTPDSPLNINGSPFFWGMIDYMFPLNQTENQFIVYYVGASSGISGFPAWVTISLSPQHSMPSLMLSYAISAFAFRNGVNK